MKKVLGWLASCAVSALLLYGILTVAPIIKASPVCSVPFTFVNGQTADANQMNANFNSVVACFSGAASSGNNSDITALTALSTPLSPSQGGSTNYYAGTSAGTNTITTGATSPTGYTLSAGNVVTFLAGGTNTGLTTLNVNGTGAKNVLRQIPGSYGFLVGAEILSTGLTTVYFNGSNYVLLNPFSGSAVPGQVIDYAAAGCPTGWAEANGGTVVAASFPDINTVLGTTWGTSGGNVVMPDLRGRTTFSRDGTGTRLTTDQNGALAGNTVGTVGGVQNQTLTAAQIPALSITALTASVTFPNSLPWTDMLNGINNTTGSSTIAFGSSGSFLHTNNLNTFNSGQISAPSVALSSGTANGAGGGNSHPVTPPLGVVTKCIKL